MDNYLPEETTGFTNLVPSDTGGFTRQKQWTAAWILLEVTVFFFLWWASMQATTVILFIVEPNLQLSKLKVYSKTLKKSKN